MGGNVNFQINFRLIWQFSNTNTFLIEKIHNRNTITYFNNEHYLPLFKSYVHWTKTSILSQINNSKTFFVSDCTQLFGSCRQVTFWRCRRQDHATKSRNRSKVLNSYWNSGNLFVVRVLECTVLLIGLYCRKLFYILLWISLI